MLDCSCHVCMCFKTASQAAGDISFAIGSVKSCYVMAQLISQSSSCTGICMRTQQGVPLLVFNERSCIMHSTKW